jgi:hypothetical protein
MQRLLATAVAVTAACRLDPLVPDQPGSSANLLPAGVNVKDIATNPDLTNQLTLNDGLDSDALMDPDHTNVIVRGTGTSGGNAVRYWAFGKATRAPAPIYLFGTLDQNQQFVPLQPDHLPLVEAIPGDYQYNPIHTIYHVVATARYKHELITTTAALADAIDLGLVEAPVATDSFLCSPIVRPGLTIEVDADAGGASITKPPTKLYAHGYLVDTFRLGFQFGPQPNPFGLLPTSQVSYLREPRAGSFDLGRPIFQAAIPTAAPQMMMPNYTPLSVEVDVDLSSGTAASITADSQLFMRDENGDIQTTSSDVAHFTVTTASSLLQLQFKKGML